MAAAAAPILNQLTVVNAGGLGECFYFSLYGASVFHNENYAALDASTPQSLPGKLIQALYRDPSRAVDIRTDVDFNREARLAVAAAIAEGILDDAEPNINKFKVLVNATTDESKAAVIKELGTGFRDLFLRGVTSLDIGAYNKLNAEIITLEGQIRRIKTVRDEIRDISDDPNVEQYAFISSLISTNKHILPPNLTNIYNRSPSAADKNIHAANLKALEDLLKEKQTVLKERDNEYNQQTGLIIAEKKYTQANFNADLATIRRTRLADFANTIDFYVINALLESSDFRVYTHIGNPDDFHGRVEFRKIALYMYDPGRDRILTQLNLLKLAGGEHYNYFCQSEIFSRFSKRAVGAGTVNQATVLEKGAHIPVLLLPNKSVPAHDTTLYGLMKFFAAAMFDIKETAIFKKDLDAGDADSGEWSRFCGEVVANLVKGLAFYRGGGPYRDAADAELVADWVRENEGDISKFAGRCGLVGSSAAKERQMGNVGQVVLHAIEKITAADNSSADKQAQLKAAAAILLALL